MCVCQLMLLKFTKIRRNDLLQYQLPSYTVQVKHLLGHVKSAWKYVVSPSAATCYNQQSSLADDGSLLLTCFNRERNGQRWTESKWTQKIEDYKYRSSQMHAHAHRQTHYMYVSYFMINEFLHYINSHVYSYSIVPVHNVASQISSQLQPTRPQGMIKG